MSRKIEITENHVKDLENSFSNVSHKSILSGRYVIFFMCNILLKKKLKCFHRKQKSHLNILYRTKSFLK